MQTRGFKSSVNMGNQRQRSTSQFEQIGILNFFTSDYGDILFLYGVIILRWKVSFIKIHRSISTAKVYFAIKTVCRSKSLKTNMIINADILMVLICYTNFVKV